MHIEQEIVSWNGKSVDDIKAIYESYNAEHRFSDTIIALLFTQACEKGASWLLKAWLEAGHELNQQQVAKICGPFNSWNTGRPSCIYCKAFPLCLLLMKKAVTYTNS